MSKTAAGFLSIAALIVGAIGANWWLRHGRSPAGASSSAYTLHLGECDQRGTRRDVRNHVATFDVDTTSTTHNHDSCAKLQTLLQSRASPPLVFWCEQGGYRL